MPRVRRYHKTPAGLLCSVVGCGKVPLARGLCKQHYMRWHRNGDLVVRLRSGQKAGDKHTNWKGDAVSENGGRLRAQKIYKLGVCERCPKPARDRHHVDGNTANNEPENILRLCRSCHMDEDGRTEMLIEKGEGFVIIIDEHLLKYFRSKPFLRIVWMPNNRTPRLSPRA